MEYYWDCFEEEVTTTIEDIAPPERYIRLHQGETDVFIERWYVGNYSFLNVAYSQFDRENGRVYGIRKRVAEENDVTLQYMTDWTVTKEHFKRMMESLEK